jgi:DNA-binding transcriptional MerR regulator/methylmalonyl-CoA mutase cobalamin-binding subunit
MYTIKQASTRTGIAIPTIRAWERRYGVVEPTRTPAGYRLYDEDAITRLVAMRQLVERDGWRPRQAAERIRSTDPEELSTLASVALGQNVQPVGVAGRPADQAVEDLVDGARRLDVRTIEHVLDEAFAGQRFEAAMDDVVFPALRGIGDAWERDELDVAREHAASETIRRRIAHFFDAAGSGDGPRIVVGLPPGSRHELGAFAFAVAARRAGLDVVYVGADVPLEAWRSAVADPPATVAVIAIVSEADQRPAADVVRALRADGLASIAVGGPAARTLAEDLDALQLPDQLDAAIASLLEVIHAGDR